MLQLNFVHVKREAIVQRERMFKTLSLLFELFWFLRLTVLHEVNYKHSQFERSISLRAYVVCVQLWQLDRDGERRKKGRVKEIIIPFILFFSFCP